MLNKIYKKISGLLFSAAAAGANFYFASSANASARQDLQTQLDRAGALPWGSAPSGQTSMTGIVATVIQAFLGLLGIIFLVLIIYAGYEWMTAQGEEEKVTKAKDTLTRAIIGLVIIIAAYSITYFVFSSLPGDGGSVPSSNPVINTGE